MANCKTQFTDGHQEKIDQYSFDIFSLFFRVASSFFALKKYFWKKVVFVLTNLFPRIFLFPSFRVITSLIYIFSYESLASTTWTQKKFFFVLKICFSAESRLILFRSLLPAMGQLIFKEIFVCISSLGSAVCYLPDY